MRKFFHALPLGKKFLMLELAGPTVFKLEKYITEFSGLSQPASSQIRFTSSLVDVIVKLLSSKSCWTISIVGASDLFYGFLY